MRARNVNPGLFINEILGTEDPYMAILFSGLWCLADREGRLEDRPRKIHAGIFPYRSITDVDTNDLLDKLQGYAFIIRYQVDSESFIQIVNWHKYQNPHHMETPSIIPPPSGINNKFNHTPISKKQRESIFHRDKEKCVVCGSSTNLHIDHIVPVGQGGTSENTNLRTLCEKCNCSKGGKSDEGWMSSRCRVDVESNIQPLVPLIPDSLIPDSLIPDSTTTPLAGGLELPLEKKPRKAKYQSQDISPENGKFLEIVYQKVPKEHPITHEPVPKGAYAMAARMFQGIVDSGEATGKELYWAGRLYYEAESLDSACGGGWLGRADNEWPTRAKFFLHVATFYGPQKRPYRQFLPIAREFIRLKEPQPLEALV
jgi:hypothetical protein